MLRHNKIAKGIDRFMQYYILWEYVDLYIHSPIPFHGVVLN
jgi:hypothetical protein